MSRYEAVGRYRDELRKRRAGTMSSLGKSATWLDMKPDFYADSRVLSEAALVRFNELKTEFPPFGLVNNRGEAYTPSTNDRRGGWFELIIALRNTGRLAVERATPKLSSCPYHEPLGDRLGSIRPPLEPLDHDQHGLDTLRNVVAPGATLNAPLFGSLAMRLPALQRLHGNFGDREQFARASVSLLKEPLGHPQQWAAGFVLSLGNISEFCSDRFLNDDLARDFTKIGRSNEGKECLEWAQPTEDLRLRSEVAVPSRVLGSETDTTGDHVIVYPVGTRLGDIAVDEPTLTCPGNQLANAMWQTTIDVAVHGELWNAKG